MIAYGIPLYVLPLFQQINYGGDQQRQNNILCID
jgi:hypothetical protein